MASSELINRFNVSILTHLCLQRQVEEGIAGLIVQLSAQDNNGVRAALYRELATLIARDNGVGDHRIWGVRLIPVNV